MATNVAFTAEDGTHLAGVTFGTGARGVLLLPQRGVDLPKSAARNGKRFGQILSHSRLLGALAGKEQNDVHDPRSE